VRRKTGGGNEDLISSPKSLPALNLSMASRIQRLIRMPLDEIFEHQF